MARGSGSSGGSNSYRQWAAAEHAAEKERERQAKQAEKDRIAAEATARDEEAAAKTEAVERRVAELEGLLRSSLHRDPRIRFESLRVSPTFPTLDLGPLATPIPVPTWEEPAAPSALGRMFGGGQRYQASREAAERDFAAAQAEYQQREAARQRGISRARVRWSSEADAAKVRANQHNAQVAEFEVGFRAHDRLAVSEYAQMVLDRSPYPARFPTERRAGYVPESSLVAVEWYLPNIDIVPEHKAFRHIKTRKVVEPTTRPPAEVRQLYLGVIAQVALRTLHEIFAATPEDMVSTVVFNGLVKTVDPRTGMAIQPHFITLRALREQFVPLVLDQPKFSPVQCVQRYFFADVSPHPEELIPVEPVMRYSMADPRVVEPIDVISTIDKRPNLMELKPKEFEAFVQNLFTKMGLDTKLFQASGDGGIDCMAYDPDPIKGGKIAIQAKRYKGTVQPAYVRELWGTVQHEGATKGILITTAGYGPDSYKFAAGKPLNLIDGTGLLALCHQYGIPARILKTGM
jgi:restriction system protein